MNNKLPNLPKIDISDLLEPTPYRPFDIASYTQTDEIQKIIEERNREIEEDRQVQKNIEVNTKKIADNTEWLSQTVNLIRINNDKQVELLSILTEVLALSNESNVDVAESKLKRILDKVQGFKENYELATFVKELGSEIIQMILRGGA